MISVGLNIAAATAPLNSPANTFVPKVGSETIIRYKERKSKEEDKERE